MENNPDVLAMVAASAALTISGIPFMGPIGAARVGYVDGEYVLNLAVDRRADSKLDLVMAGTAGRRADGRVGSPGAVRRNHARRRDVRPRSSRKKVIEAIIKLAELAAKEPRDFTAPDNSALEKECSRSSRPTSAPPTRSPRRKTATPRSTPPRPRSRTHYAAQVEAGTVSGEDVGAVFHNLQAKIVRWNILDTKTAHRRP